MEILILFFTALVLAIVCFLYANREYLFGGRHSTARFSIWNMFGQAQEILPPALYEKTRLLTNGEKSAFAELCKLCTKHGYTVLAKVPLCMIIVPRVHGAQYSTALKVLSTTYADFVICDAYMKTSIVVTLEFSELDVVRGAVRDNDLDMALQQCGVEVLHTASIDSKTCAWIEERISPAV